MAQQKSQPYGFPEIEPLPSRNIWEPKPVLPSRQLPDYNYYPRETPAMDAFYESAMNPPVRQKPSALRMVGTGLLSALQGSTGPESRKPVFNAAGKVVGSRESGFWESLGNRPFDVDESKHILDMPYEAGMEDYGTKMKGLSTAASIESNYPSKQALTAQRMAAANAAPIRAEAAAQTADARTTDAETRARVASLKDLPDSEKIRLLQEDRISLQDIRDAAALQRTQTVVGGANERNTANITSREGIVDTQQENANYRANVMAGAAQGRTETGGAQTVIIKDPNTGEDRVFYANPRTPQAPMAPAQIEGAPPGTPVGGVQRPGIQTDGGQETPQEIARLQSIRQSTLEALNLIDEIADPTTGKLKSQSSSAVGKSFLAGYIPSTGAFSGRKDINKLQSMLIKDLIGEMKAQSRTGATGFGQLNMEELGLLKNAASKLDTGLDEGDFEREIKRIREKLNMVLLPGNKITVTGQDKQETREERAQRLLKQRSGRP